MYMILGQKYEVSLLHVPIFELTKIFDFIAYFCPYLDQFHAEPVLMSQVMEEEGYIWYV